MIFVDTGVWFSLFVPSDPHHGHVQDWIESNSEPLITTDYILDETLTLLRARGQYHRALVVGTVQLERTPRQPEQRLQVEAVEHLIQGDVALVEDLVAPEGRGRDGRKDGTGGRGRRRRSNTRRGRPGRRNGGRNGRRGGWRDRRRPKRRSPAAAAPRPS